MLNMWRLYKFCYIHFKNKDYVFISQYISLLTYLHVCMFLSLCMLIKL